jgi:light-regulated signal transduction histidine kinase (bacteriophytochrome)
MNDNQQLGEQIDRLTTSNDDLTQFAYLAAHDLREPLRAITGFLTLLKDEHGAELSPEAGELLAQAANAADRMCTLIQALLTLSRVESQEVVFDMVDSHSCVDDALHNLKVEIERKNAVIKVYDLPLIRGNETLITLVFQNLIANSLKFCEIRPEIEILASQKENEWIFTVKDNGVGFDANYTDKLFHRFQRLHARGRFPGTGLGLALCKRIVDRHSGRIWAHSKESEGATFYFALPAESSA